MKLELLYIELFIMGLLMTSQVTNEQDDWPNWRVKEVGGSWEKVISAINSAPSNTRIVIKPGKYIANKAFVVRPKNNITVEAKKLGTVKIFGYKDGISYHGSPIKFRDSKNLWIRNLVFEKTGGNGLMLENCQDVIIESCIVRNTYKSGIQIVGCDNVIIESVEVTGCCAINTKVRNKKLTADHTIGVWPYATGCWFGEDGEPNQNIFFMGCDIHHNHGEGINLSFIHGASVINCVFDSNLYVAGPYIHGSDDVSLINNVITCTQPWLSKFGNGPTAIRISIEGWGDNPPLISPTNLLIADNTIDGGDSNLIRDGIIWKVTAAHPAGDGLDRYSEVKLIGNKFNGIVGPFVHFGEVIGLPPENCEADFEFDGINYITENPESWKLVE